ncbi:hypothetical protein A9K72_02235 [Mesorhizobium loti]|jgi:hypothetical protein|uniref:Uncharacterized protein n=1 Tax=Mesorhizobium jarvisii TaxID=1777867 RepID=A0AA92XGB5_9HYPH|nr:hypothetical protein A9K72_02235 [Mesorhizobium loti]RJT33943.1 hypothetical protein D3242_15605 [Mesorhizobium jarvisii]
MSHGPADSRRKLLEINRWWFAQIRGRAGVVAAVDGPAAAQLWVTKGDGNRAFRGMEIPSPSSMHKG